jgi:hypothetical protein
MFVAVCFQKLMDNWVGADLCVCPYPIVRGCRRVVPERVEGLLRNFTQRIGQCCST